MSALGLGRGGSGSAFMLRAVFVGTARAGLLLLLPSRRVGFGLRDVGKHEIARRTRILGDGPIDLSGVAGERAT